MSVFRTKSIEQSLADTDEPEYQLKRRLTAIDLTVFGIGVVIGAGIFTLTGQVAAEYAGPGVVFSFVLAAICCATSAVWITHPPAMPSAEASPARRPWFAPRAST